MEIGPATVRPDTLGGARRAASAAEGELAVVTARRAADGRGSPAPSLTPFRQPTSGQLSVCAESPGPEVNLLTKRLHLAAARGAEARSAKSREPRSTPYETSALRYASTARGSPLSSRKPM